MLVAKFKNSMHHGVLRMKWPIPLLKLFLFQYTRINKEGIQPALGEKVVEPEGYVIAPV